MEKKNELFTFSVLTPRWIARGQIIVLTVQIQDVMSKRWEVTSEMWLWNVCLKHCKRDKPQLHQNTKMQYSSQSRRCSSIYLSIFHPHQFVFQVSGHRWPRWWGSLPENVFLRFTHSSTVCASISLLRADGPLLEVFSQDPINHLPSDRSAD